METSQGDEEEVTLTLEIEKQICRCCLATEKTMKSAVEVQQYFMELAGINVMLSDGMPQWVCVECGALMQKAIAFKYKMLRAHSVLYEYLMRCTPSRIKPSDPYLDRYKSPLLTTTPTLTFDTTEENIGFHKVLQQEKRILKSELNDVPLLPIFENPQTAFESVEAAFSDFEDDPLEEYKFQNTEDAKDMEEDGDEEVEEEDIDEDEDIDDEDEEDDEDVDEDDDIEDDNTDDDVKSEPEVKRIKSDKRPLSTNIEKISAIKPYSEISPSISWTGEKDGILIDFVRRNEALYNPKSELYKISVLKQKLWKDIATILNKTDSDCYKRWCYVRDYYIRRRDKLATGGEAARRRASLLAFLDRVPTQRAGGLPHDAGGEEPVKEEGSSNVEPDPWEGIRIGEQYCKMASNDSWSIENEDILINFVRRNQPLYNQRCKDYRKVQVKQKLWREVAALINKTESACYKRWCYVRDYYIRRKSNPGALSSGKAAKRRADLLSFLDSVPSPPRTEQQDKQILKSELSETQATHSPAAVHSRAEGESAQSTFSHFARGQYRIGQHYSKMSSNESWTADNDDTLIGFVRRNELLYNPKSKDFRKARLKQKLWYDIGTILHKTDSDCYKRWCYVRDYYIRRRGKAGILSTGKAAKRRADLLSFLDSVPSPQRTAQENQNLKSELNEGPQPLTTEHTRTPGESVQACARSRLEEFRDDQHAMSSSVSWTSENDEILINFVRRNEPLYNPKSRNTELKQKLWCDAGAILNKTDSDCYKRWCYVRDYYIRRRDKLATGGEAARRRATLLAFLDRVPSSQRTSLTSVVTVTPAPIPSGS